MPQVQDTDSLKAAFNRVLRYVLSYYILDAVIKGVFFALVRATVNGDGHTLNCEEMDERLVCRYWLKYYQLVEGCVTSVKLFIALRTCRLASYRELDKECKDRTSSSLKVLQCSTLGSMTFYATQYAAVYSDLTERSKIFGILPLLSLISVVVSEVGRRRLDQIAVIYLEQLTTACARSAPELPQLEWRELEHSTAQELSCAICLSEFSPEDLVSQLPCKHCFHTECIQTWLSAGANSRCPLRCPEDPLSLVCTEPSTVIGQASV